MVHDIKWLGSWEVVLKPSCHNFIHDCLGLFFLHGGKIAALNLGMILTNFLRFKNSNKLSTAAFGQVTPYQMSADLVWICRFGFWVPPPIMNGHSHIISKQWSVKMVKICHFSRQFSHVYGQLKTQFRYVKVQNIFEGHRVLFARRRHCWSLCLLSNCMVDCANTHKW